eukprot:CAMPEP_0184652064 /NCGR_PEP_ID=MMETSP0308-20130426/9730_1 /TAXON_ID=38269 /ORGANISM="Gloeochaete witrockiana, Strain SAG 46.84" /LENGTH=35 /DNA_ID= /DNA_START= /DNA_END= /DNA_ORIENTATION=
MALVDLVGNSLVKGTTHMPVDGIIGCGLDARDRGQ